MEELTIGELAQRVGVRTSALRYYESVGLLAPARRVSGQRRYSADALERLAVVQLAQQAGFSVAEIQTLLYGFAPDTAPGERWRPLAERKLAEVGALIERAQAMQRLLANLLDCGCGTLEECGVDAGAHCAPVAAPPE